MDGGIEVPFAPNISAKVEYLYVDLGNGMCDFATCSAFSSADVKFHEYVIRGGINFRF